MKVRNGEYAYKPVIVVTDIAVELIIEMQAKKDESKPQKEFVKLLDSCPAGEDEELLDLEDDENNKQQIKRDNPLKLLTCIGTENFMQIVDAQFDSYRSNNVWILKHYINKNVFTIQRN